MNLGSVGSRAEAPIGVFDSGVGGLSVLNALREAMPLERFVYFADTAHAPYGERGDAHVSERTRDVARYLIRSHRVKALVVACNTATAAAVHLVRNEYQGLPVIGVEPALKPAVAASATGRIGVLATRGTLRSAKFEALHASLAGQADFMLRPCDGLAAAIEAHDAERIAALCREHMGALGRLGTAQGEIDSVVLGCTHYPFVAETLRAHAPAAVRFFETGEPVAQQTRRLLTAGNQLASAGHGQVALWTSGAAEALDAAAERWLRGRAAPAHRAEVPLHQAA